METGFFKWIWRFNGVVIACASLIFLITTVFSAVVTYNSWMSGESVFAVRHNDEEKLPKVRDEKSFRYGTAFVAGDAYVVPLVARRRSLILGAGSYALPDQVNYLHVAADGQSTWLFDGVDQLALNKTELKRPLGDQNAPIVAYTLEVVRRDTNGDQRLSDRDRKGLCLLDAAFSVCTPILTDHDSYQLVGETEEALTIAATRDKAVTLFTLSLADQTILREQALPAVETALPPN
ncbi:hypothetical protein [Thalassobius sp. Cn5-15]|uniref:hypothetical protein n=1 Tax=Thalassobius sp. Cn5-15 TaxID=2917763 RepID=UPI001EF26248|nr:hypothetical protein [Thalassobius sp. Cn5-15]MCG7493450.1 hypothetical protein [Thalassobius sp. Cn5-15]